MGEVTARMLRQAAEQAVAWQAAGRPLRVAVNLATSCLVNPSLLTLLDDVLDSTGMDPRRLVLEVTETSLMSDPAQSLQVARDIAARGIGISIDDYGTGYSSLAYLNDLPAQELKLDRSFTARLLTDERTATIVAATVDLAHRLGLQLTAEGVEDAATLEALRDLGCDETQGYLHSPPLPVAAFDAWLAGRRAAVPRPAGPGRSAAVSSDGLTLVRCQPTPPSSTGQPPVLPPVPSPLPDRR